MVEIAIIGLGEAGSALVRGWGPARAGSIRAYDIKTDSAETAAEIETRGAAAGDRVFAARSPRRSTGADLVFCTVTADQAGTAAHAGAVEIGQGTAWLDLNSCAPSTKRASATTIEAAGGQYLDVAVMSPVHPKLNMVPCLVAGPDAEALAAVMADLPMAVRVAGAEVGQASSIKMIRSVMVKGLEALTAECVLAAVAAGVEDEVLGSLAKSHAGTDWRARSAYNFERMVVHGTRRAAEMEEVVTTLNDLGLPADVTEGTVRWQRRMAGAIPAPAGDEDLVALAQALLAQLRQD
jgi:3-hydroxyisobutyrate dehydrogenase-like beta-hydroxyacid dehydrogenase